MDIEKKIFLRFNIFLLYDHIGPRQWAWTPNPGTMNFKRGFQDHLHHAFRLFKFHHNFSYDHHNFFQMKIRVEKNVFQDLIHFHHTVNQLVIILFRDILPIRWFATINVHKKVLARSAIQNLLDRGKKYLRLSQTSRKYLEWE